jgi:1-deoxy-D-xylulose-5-phosphate reductoisomerase
MSLGALTFEDPDVERFPCLRLAFDALKASGTMPAVLNAANEVAVSAFLENRIGFSDIAKINRSAMTGHAVTSANSIETVVEADREARQSARSMVAELSRTAVAA